MDSQAQEILDDLRRHAGLFDLAGDLGADLTAVARNGVFDHFDQQLDPNGVRWPELSSDYSRWKDRHFPGEPMGRLHGPMREGLDGGTDLAKDSAEWTAGDGGRATEELAWFQDGDPVSNRPPRVVVGLNAESIGKSDQITDQHFEKGTDG